MEPLVDANDPSVQMSPATSVDASAAPSPVVQTAWQRFGSGAGRVWPHLRAVFIIWHMAVIVVLSLPSPHTALKKTQWKNASVQQELTTWHDILTKLGLSSTREEFEEDLYQSAKTFSAGRATVVAPLDKYSRLTGTREGWHMFTSPDRNPMRLLLEVNTSALDTPAKWTFLYRTGDFSSWWRRDLTFAYRMRKAVFSTCWSPGMAKKNDLCKAFARLVAEDFPNASQLRCTYERERLPSPEEYQTGVRYLYRKPLDVSIVDLASMKVTSMPRKSATPAKSPTGHSSVPKRMTGPAARKPEIPSAPSEKPADEDNDDEEVRP